MAAEPNTIRIKNATDHEIRVAVQQEVTKGFLIASGSGSYYALAPGQVESWGRSAAAQPHYLYWVQDQGVTRKFRTSSTADKSYLGNVRIFDGLYSASVAEEPPQQNPCPAPIAEGQYYYIVSRHSGKVLTNPPGIMALQQAARKPDGAGQLFRFTAAGGGYYFITAKHSEEEIFAVGASDYAEVYMNDKDSPGSDAGTRVHWYFEDAGGGYYYLKCRNGNKPMEVYGAHKEDGAKTVI